jgi:hypothetical protein
LPQEYVVPARLLAEYFAFIFFAACGVIQMAAAYVRLKGLLFLKRPLPSYILGGLLILGAFLWFFLAEERNQRGLEGREQFGFFVLGCLAALAFSLILSSLINWRLKPPPNAPPKEGMDILEDMSYFEAVKYSLRRWRGKQADDLR